MTRVAAAALLVLAVPAFQDWSPSERARQALEELKKKHPASKGFRHDCFGYVAHACKADAKHTDRAIKFIRTYADWASKELFEKRPEVLYIVSFSETKDFREYSGKSGAAGYYSPASKTLVNNLQTGLGTVGHEMTHALMIGDWGGKIPNGWFLEGFAAMMENALRLSDGTFVGINFGHWRFLQLKPKILNGSVQGARECMNRRGPEGNSYVQGRWMITYLHVQGLLKKFHKEFRATMARDGSGITAFEKVVGKNVEEWEKEWHEWSKEIEIEIDDPRTHLYPVLGILGRNKSEGLEIAAVSPGSVAEIAKLREGDVIVRFGGASISNMADLIAELKKAREGSREKVEILRDGKPESVNAKLDQFIDG